MGTRSKHVLSLFLFTVTIAACGPRRLELPTGAGTPVSDFAGPFGAATEQCAGVTSLTAELGLSGRAGKQRLRGTVLAGLAPDAVRLEGVAPFGSPLFVLAGQQGRATLLLPRDRRVLPDAAPAEILDALIGVRLSPDDLRAAITGCVKARPRAIAGRAHGADWLAVDLEGGGTAYLRRTGSSWRLVAGNDGRIEIEYGEWLGAAAQLIHVRTTGPSPSSMSLRLRDRQLNAAIEPAAFTVVVPPGMRPITLDELRDAGPMGQ